MSKFEQALEKVLEHEGGYSDDPLDRGGKTNYGITEGIWNFYNNGSPPYPIEKITKEDAKRIYHDLYWKQSKLDLIENDIPLDLLTQIFDSAVNHGQGNAIRFLQRAHNFIQQKDKPLKEDGVMGPKTREAILNTVVKYSKALLAAYIGERFRFYQEIVKRDPSQLRFIRGWVTRILTGIQ